MAVPIGLKAWVNLLILSSSAGIDTCTPSCYDAALAHPPDSSRLCVQPAHEANQARIFVSIAVESTHKATLKSSDSFTFDE